MGQTVSLGSCISGGSVVRVMNTAGVFESYEFPVVTAEVMLKHPNHLVVHCAPTQATGASKINIMLPEQPLLPGEPYMLYPIPERHKAALASSKSFSMLRRQISGIDGEVSAAPEKKKGRRHALKLVASRLQLATLVAGKLGNKAEKEQHQQPLLDSKEEKQKKKAPQPLDMPYYHWKPDLASIPESPLGFHSTPQTPRGLYKMDAISEGRPYSVSYPGQTTALYQPPVPTISH